MSDTTPAETPNVPTADQILSKLTALADAGDLPGLKDALSQWDERQVADDGTWFTPTTAERFVDIRHQIPAGSLPLQRVLNAAAKSGHADIITYLLNQRGCAVTAPAIRWAISRKHWDVMQAYVDSGWDINTPIEGGNTCPILKYVYSPKVPLLLLMEYRESIPNEERARWCLEHGADPSFRSAGGNNDIPSFAGKAGSITTLKLMEKHGAKLASSNALLAAAGSTSSGRIEVMTYLIDELKVPINQREYEYDQKIFEEGQLSTGGGTALHSAVQQKRLEHIEFLISKGIDQKLKDTKGREAVDLARDFKFDEVVALLEA